MKVAVVGAGFSGLAISWHLLQKGAVVTLFDRKGIGAGASGTASGLLHPYPGEQIRRSWQATEALQATKDLLQEAQKKSSFPVAEYSGLIRLAQTCQQQQILCSHQEQYGDIQRLDESRFLITSGITVYSDLYLKGLHAACLEQGLRWEICHVDDASSLMAYDAVVWAIGVGSLQDPRLPPCSAIKGQVLLCRGETGLRQSLLGKGHIIPLGPGRFHLGATYERGKIDDVPDIQAAFFDLAEKARGLQPDLVDFSVDDCKAGVRVMRKGHYLPLVGRLDEKEWVCTAMGSRGLLYHAHCAKILAEAVFQQDDSLIPLCFAPKLL